MTTMIAAILASLLFQGQDDADAKARALIEKLRAERIEDRSDAARALRGMGKSAIPALRKAAQDPDLEVAGRALGLIQAIDVREKIRAEIREQGSVDAATVVDWMAAESGKRILSSEDLGLRNRKLRLTLQSFDGAPAYETAVDLLKLIDFAVVADPSAPNTISIVAAPVAAKKNLPIFDSVDRLPAANEFCTLVMTMTHISPREAQAVLINTISFPQNCLTVETAGKVVLSDYSSNLRRHHRLVQQMDLPRPVVTYRINIALLAARTDAAASVPEAFRTLRLTEATGKNRFDPLGEGFVRMENVDMLAIPGVKPVPSVATLRFPGTPAYGVDAEGPRPAAGGIALERLTLRSDAEPDRKAAPLLQTRITLKKGEWTVAGAIPSEREGTVLILLARADPE